MADAILEEQPTAFYERVPCDLPGVGVWLPTTKTDACASKEEESKAVEDIPAQTSILKRVVSAYRNAIPSMSRSNSSRGSSRVSQTLRSTKSAKNSGVQLTALEKQYLYYLRRSVETGEFSHYLVPAP